jgi:psiF repeat
VKTKLLCVIACVALSNLAVAPVRADDTHKPEVQHEEKTRTAEAEAPHKAAIEKAPVHRSQQEKMKTCNVEAGKKNLHGDERRAFMSSCLKG